MFQFVTLLVPIAVLISALWVIVDTIKSNSGKIVGALRGTPQPLSPVLNARRSRFTPQSTPLRKPALRAAA